MKILLFSVACLAFAIAFLLTVVGFFSRSQFILSHSPWIQKRHTTVVSLLLFSCAILGAGLYECNLEIRPIDLRPLLMSWQVGSPNELNKTALLLVMKVNNVGKPTIVEGWHLYIAWPNGKEDNVPPEGERDIKLANGISYRKEETLWLKTLQPIPEGGKQTGVLIYFIPDGYTTDELLHSSARVVLIDVTGEKHSVSVDWTMNRGTTIPEIQGVGANN